MREFDDETAIALQEGLGAISRALHLLGTGNAATEMGVANALESVALAIRESAD